MSKDKTGVSRPMTGTKVGTIVQDEIGAKLRQLYSDMAQEPVPDRFIELLKQLEQGKK
jgi:hypothetical protein